MFSKRRTISPKDHRRPADREGGKEGRRRGGREGGRERESFAKLGHFQDWVILSCVFDSELFEGDGLPVTREMNFLSTSISYTMLRLKGYILTLRRKLQ